MYLPRPLAPDDEIVDKSVLDVDQDVDVANASETVADQDLGANDVRASRIDSLRVTIDEYVSHVSPSREIRRSDRAGSGNQRALPYHTYCLQ
jgi:hypothetical protein